MEMSITGTNAITFPTLHVWDWRIAIYLFLGGLAGGLMAMSAVSELRAASKSGKDTTKSACSWPIPLLAFILLSIGLFFLWMDLERKLQVFRFYLNFQPYSPMSWGGWLVLALHPPLILYAFASVPEEIKARMKDGFLKSIVNATQPHLLKLARINFVFGILLAVYTGILLSTFVARPLWNSAILPVLFLTSALSTGAAVMIIMSKKKETKLFFTKMDIWLIFAEILVLLLFFYGHYTGDAVHRQAIMPFFNSSHEFFPYFLSIATLGIVLPLAIVFKFLEVTAKHTDELTTSGLFLMNASAILVLLGGLVIRFAMVYAGQLSGYAGIM